MDEKQTPPSPIATAEIIHDIGATAHDLLIDILDAWDDPESPVHARLALVGAALRFAALAAAEAGNTEMIDILSSALTMTSEYDDHDHTTDSDIIGQALTDILARGVRADAQVKEMADDETANVRRAVAAGLRPSGEPEIAILRKLAKDTDGEVRTAAKKSLAGVAEIPWWAGKLSCDPATLMTASQAKRAAEPLASIAQLMDVEGYLRRGNIPKIAALAKTLPAAVSADIAEHVLAAPNAGSDGAVKAFGDLFLKGPSPEAALVRLLPKWSNSEALWIGSELAPAIARLPAPRRAALCKKLVAGALVHLEDGGDATAAMALSAKLGASAWPLGEDLAPVVDRVEALAREHEDDPDQDWTTIVWSLEAAFSGTKPKKGPTLERIVGARFACDKAPWSFLERALSTHLEKLDRKTLRQLAERAAAAPRVETVEWGLRLLADEVYDAKSDPPRPALFAAWCADPRLRRAVAQSRELRLRALPTLRAALRAGELDAATAGSTLLATHILYGGLCEWNYRQGALDAEIEEARPFAGKKALRGPITAEEWDAYRLARDKATADEALLRLTSHIVPPGPWDASDLAYMKSAVTALRAGAEIGFPLAGVIASKPDPRAHALFEEVYALLPDETQRLLRPERAAFVEAFGEIGVAGAAAPEAPAPAAPSVPSAPKKTNEWMDEPDDDER